MFMKSFKGVCLWDSLFVSGLNQCRTWNCFACYGIFSEVGTAILAGSVPGLGSSKVLVLDTWYLMQNLEYLVLTCTWHFEIQKYLVLTCTWRQSTWYLSKYFQAVFPLIHNRCEVVISWWSPLLPKISIYATKCESILEKSEIFIHLQSKYCINLSCKKNLTISWVQIAARW